MLTLCRRVACESSLRSKLGEPREEVLGCGTGDGASSAMSRLGDMGRKPSASTVASIDAWTASTASDGDDTPWRAAGTLASKDGLTRGRRRRVSIGSTSTFARRMLLLYKG